MADAIHVPCQRINELENQKRGIMPSTALRLARFFGASANFWMNRKIRGNLYKAEQSEREDLVAIHDFSHWQKLA